jgi:hypothetical protein
MADLQLVKLLDAVTIKGEKGDTGEGVIAGGAINQVLRKKSVANFDTEWADGGIDHKTQGYVTWGSVSSVSLRSMAQDEIINAIQVIIMEAFNGVGAVVTIGTDADHDLLVGASDIDLTTVGTYLINPGYKFPANADVKIFHTAGSGASTGSGTVIINF